MSKHTPGPWVINHSGLQEPTGDYDHIHAESNRALQAICKVVRRHDSKANAKLIAAAPDLLEALEALLDWGRDWTSPNDPHSPHELLVNACTAIAKAREG